MFLEYLDITEGEFWDVINGYRSTASHLWKQVDGEWQLKRQVS